MPRSKCSATLATNGWPSGPFRPTRAATAGAPSAASRSRPPPGPRPACSRPRPAAPAKALQQRDAVDDDEPLDALGLAARPREPDRRAPVVHAQPHPIDLQRVEQPVDERDVAGERVVEVAALAAAPEAGQVGGDPAAELSGPSQSNEDVGRPCR